MLDGVKDAMVGFDPDVGARRYTGGFQEWLKRFPLLVKLKGRLWRNATTLNVWSSFPLYVPNSVGNYDDKSALTIRTINQVFPFLQALSESVSRRSLEIKDIGTVTKTEQQRQAAAALKERFDFYGSDKANVHNYHCLYGSILCDGNKARNILEIGLGTNNMDVVSHMGKSGRPGASLRAFRDFCPNADIYGADIDRRILFSETRIETYFVDQMDPSTLERLASVLPVRAFDLVVDDGLHSPDANVATLRFALEIVRKHGWVVIEDIGPDSGIFWKVVAALLPENYRAELYRAEDGMVFAVQRLD